MRVAGLGQDGRPDAPKDGALQPEEPCSGRSGGGCVGDARAQACVVGFEFENDSDPSEVESVGE
jgi:hypothetical protein